MAWTTQNSLNRWCLRSLHENSDSPLHNLLHAGAGIAVLRQHRHKGPPPLMNACIAPHCDAWRPESELRGVCAFREKLRQSVRR